MPDLPAELRELDEAIAALERQRGQLPDAVVNAAIDAIRVRRSAVSAQVSSGSAIAQGENALAVGVQGVAVGGDNYGSTPA